MVVAESGIGATEGTPVVGDTSLTSPGVEGLSGTGGIGVHGVAGGQVPLVVLSSGGVVGETTEGPGVAGASSNGTGVYGFASANDQIGVWGEDVSSAGGSGVLGQSNAGTGGVFAGGHAPLLLESATGTGPPPPPGHNPGEFYVDFNGALFYCYNTDEWVALTNGTFPIPPVRVIDTTAGTGGITGPLVPG